MSHHERIPVFVEGEFWKGIVEGIGSPRPSGSAVCEPGGVATNSNGMKSGRRYGTGDFCEKDCVGLYSS